jgi:hypothetical protein
MTRAARTNAATRRHAAMLSHRPHFDRNRLPEPEAYYTAELGTLHGRGTWRDAVCCFHQDARPSLRVNTQTGAFRCMACGAHGGDVLSFHMARYDLPFPAACKALGAMTGGRHG